MNRIKKLTSFNISTIQSGYNIGCYVTFFAGAGLTTSSFLISGGSLVLLVSGIMCGAGLQLTLKSLKEITKNTNEQNGWNKLLYNTSLGALNGLISSIGLVCIAQHECNQDLNDNMDATQQLVTSYALTGLITGTINGTINEVINHSNNHMPSKIQNGGINNEIELLNVGKSSFMEMGSNMITAIGKFTLFKSVNDINTHNINSRKLIKIHRPYLQRDIFKQQISSLSYQWNLKQYGSFSNILAMHKPQQRKRKELKLYQQSF